MRFGLVGFQESTTLTLRDSGACLQFSTVSRALGSLGSPSTPPFCPEPRHSTPSRLQAFPRHTLSSAPFTPNSLSNASATHKLNIQSTQPYERKTYASPICPLHSFSGGQWKDGRLVLRLEAGLTWLWGALGFCWD